MDKEFQKTPLSYGLNMLGSKVPFDFSRIFKLRVWTNNLDDSKRYLKSLVEHWVILYKWDAPIMFDLKHPNTKKDDLYYTAGRLFVAMLIGQYVLAMNKNVLPVTKVFKKYPPTDKSTSAVKGRQESYLKQNQHIILDTIHWSTKHIGIRSTTLLFVMQMSLHDGLSQFFDDVVKAYHQSTTAKDYFRYMTELWNSVKDKKSNHKMQVVYSTLSSMLRTCFKKEIEL